MDLVPFKSSFIPDSYSGRSVTRREPRLQRERVRKGAALVEFLGGVE